MDLRARKQSFHMCVDSKVVLLAVPESETEIGELEKYLTSITKALTDRGFKVAFEVKGSGS
jgi:hypothetical protein